jgi:hypothetical protein
MRFGGAGDRSPFLCPRKSALEIGSAGIRRQSVSVFLRRARSPESRKHRLQLQYKSKAVTLTAGRQRIISMTSGSSAPPRASFFRNLAIA